jgi:hypothetical protein
LRNPQVDTRFQRALAGIAALALLLGGCTHTQPHTVAAAEPQPAAQAPCVQASEIPAEPPMVGAKFNGDAKHDLQVLAPNAKALRDWGQQMHAMLQACTAPATGAPAAKP